MTTARPRPPIALLFAASMIGLIVVHTFAYIGAYPSTFSHSMADTGHQYWPLLVVASVALAAGAIIGSRQRARFARTGTRSPATLAVMFMTFWAVVLVGSIVAYLLLENIEALIRDTAPPLLAAGRTLRIPAVAFAVVAGTALIAAVVVLVTTSRQRSYEAVITDSYRSLVAGGTYSPGWSQPAWAEAFVTTVLSRELDGHASTRTPPSVLECGCGTGVWLTVAARLAEERRGSLAGFDLSSEMAEAARERLASSMLPVSIWVGDVLDDRAYEPGGNLYDLIFVYDVVQQLPADVQAESIDAMLRHVRPGGSLVVFDNDSKSRFGRTMGAKKWLRRYLNIPLVPKFYIHARYPDLKAMRRRFERRDHSVDILAEEQLRKRALVIRVPT